MANEQNVEPAVNQAMVVALSALGWTMTDTARADRLLALTGLSPSNLRRSVENPTLLAAVLQFLESHEPDLIACATALQLDPAELVRARTTLEAQSS